MAYLESYDQFVERVRYVVEMSSAMYDLLHRFLRQNDGTLPKRARTKEFAELTEGEVEEIETIFAECME